MRRVFFTAALSVSMAAADPASAQDSASELKQAVQALRDQMKKMQSGYEGEIKRLETRLQTLEKKPETTVVQAPSSAAGETSRVDVFSKQSPIQIGLNGNLISGGSSVGNEALGNLQRGHHDPKTNGFSVSNVELFVGGTVDPYFDAQANIALQIDSEGETSIELEEAFFTTRNLPGGLQVKGGQYFTEFGRANTQHPHSWSFVDQPVVLSRLFGADGLRSQGARVSWLTPLPWFSEFTVGAQNAKGETAASFLGEEGEDIGGFELQERGGRNFSDLLWSARWLNGVDLSDTVSANLGFSGAVGPNATGSNTNTYLLGMDLYMKWQPTRSQGGFPFVAWQSEIMGRKYEALDSGDPDHKNLHDWGFYTQALWGFKPGWVAGLRLEHADGRGNNADDPFRDSRWRVSPNLTWHPTEFSKVRLQYNRDWAQHLAEKSADTVWLQLEYSLGSHFAHTF
ncbi:MAG: TonB-dependent receptor [Rhodospirillales bacterium]